MINSQAKLKCKETKVFQVDYRDFENFIMEFYGHEFEFVVTEECRNGDTRRFIIRENYTFFNEFNEKSLKEFIETGIADCSSYLFFYDLARKGVIEYGTYIVNTSW